MALADHPTVQRVRGNGRAPARPEVLDADWLRELALAAGADDVGFVSLDDPAVASERETALEALPGAQSLIALVGRTRRDDVRSPARSVANLEFHDCADELNAAARTIVGRLEELGVRAINPSVAFPMEMSKFPARTWVIAHKTVAVAAGLGQIGVHRNVIHPRFGSFVLLGTVVTQARISEYSKPIDYNPCLNCNLCVAACPVGAIDKSGDFDFVSCYTHNYRDFMSGFTDWVQTVADSDSAADYRERVPDNETVQVWQSLSYKPNYKAAYCVAVCPAGEDVIGPFLEDRKQHLTEVVKPLQRKEETVYVVPDSKAEHHVRRRFPHKTVRQVDNGLLPPAA